MNECIFCKIVKKEIPSSKIYEDDSFFAFLDINPISKGHALIIPKNHIVWMQEAEDKTIMDGFVLAKKIMLNIKEKLPCDFVQVSVVGKDVPHFHIHLIPRFFKDELHGWRTLKYENGEIEEIGKKLKIK